MLQASSVLSMSKNILGCKEYRLYLKSSPIILFESQVFYHRGMPVLENVSEKDLVEEWGVALADVSYIAQNFTGRKTMWIA